MMKIGFMSEESMGGDFSGYLHRYQGRAVSIVTWDHVRMLGTLAEVTYDSILMTGVLIQDSHDSSSWSDHMLIEDLLDDRANQWPEIVVARNLISTVTLVDPRGVRKTDRYESEMLTPEELIPDDPAPAESERHHELESNAVCLEMGVSLIPLVNKSPDGTKPLKEQVRALRLSLEKNHGFQFSEFRIRSNFELPHDQFRLLVHGTEVFRAEVCREKLMAILPAGAENLPFGISTIEPAFGLPARWICLEDRSAAERANCTVVSPGSVIVTAVGESLKNHIASLLTYDAVNVAVEHLRESHPVTVAELVPSPVSVRTLFEVLRQLVDEGVVVSHLRPILESVARHVEHSDSMERLVASVRRDIPLTLVQGLINSDGKLPVITVNSVAADALCRSQSATEPLSQATTFQASIQGILKDHRVAKAVIVVPQSQRKQLWKRFRLALPETPFLGTDELPATVPLKVLGGIDQHQQSPGAAAELCESADENVSELLEPARRKPR